MSIKVMSQVWQSSTQTGGALLVELAIADYADDDGCAFPSVVSLAKKARLTERQTWKVIADLKKAGTLKVEVGGGRGRSNRYRLVVGNPEPENTELKNTENHSVNSTPLNPELRDTETLNSVTQNPELHDRGSVIEPSIEPSENRQYKKPRSQARSKPVFEIWLDDLFVPAYPEHRQCQYATALGQLRQLKPDVEQCAAIMERLEAWKVSDDWTKEGGDFVPGMGKFFKDGWFKRAPKPRPLAAANNSPVFGGSFAPLEKYWPKKEISENELPGNGSATHVGQGELVHATGERRDRLRLASSAGRSDGSAGRD